MSEGRPTELEDDIRECVFDGVLRLSKEKPNLTNLVRVNIQESVDSLPSCQLWVIRGDHKIVAKITIEDVT